MNRIMTLMLITLGGCVLIGCGATAPIEPLDDVPPEDIETVHLVVSTEVDEDLHVLTRGSPDVGLVGWAGYKLAERMAADKQEELNEYLADTDFQGRMLSSIADAVEGTDMFHVGEVTKVPGREPDAVGQFLNESEDDAVMFVSVWPRLGINRAQINFWIFWWIVEPDAVEAYEKGLQESPWKPDTDEVLARGEIRNWVRYRGASQVPATAFTTWMEMTDPDFSTFYNRRIDNLARWMEIDLSWEPLPDESWHEIETVQWGTNNARLVEHGEDGTVYRLRDGRLIIEEEVDIQ